MFGNRDIPVYLFTGFLESGKSTCFQEILEEGNFEDGLRTLYLMTEEGEKEVDPLDKVTLTDTVSYTGLVPRKEYKVTGVLMDKETSEKLLVDGK